MHGEKEGGQNWNMAKFCSFFKNVEFKVFVYKNQLSFGKKNMIYLLDHTFTYLRRLHFAFFLPFNLNQKRADDTNELMNMYNYYQRTVRH